jgi:two-component system, NarL family, nitrate/nitrite response regulator NarL
VPEESARTIVLVGGLGLVRAARSSVLTRFGWHVVADTSDVTTAAEASSLHRAGVALVDVDVPGGSFLAVRRIVEQAPAVSVLVVAPELDQETLVAALRAGATGFVPETIGAGGLARAVEVAFRGEAVVPRAAVLALIEEVRGELREKHASEDGLAIELTRREADVMARRREGMTPKEIAHELGLSAVTVRRHLSSVAHKARQTRPLTLALESTS